MKLLKVAALSAALLSGGCATEMSWQRTDGRPLDSSFAWAAGHCRERARQHWGEERADAMQRCMRRHGYVWTTVVVSGNGYNGYDDYNGYNGYNGYKSYNRYKGYNGYDDD